MADEKSRLNSMNNSFLGQIPTNPLDNFDNVTYNIKLYMIPPDEDNTENKSDSTEGEERSDTGGEVTSRGGFLNGAYVARPENTVVLAQTGVTATFIDNVVLTTVPSGKGGKITQGIDCTIKQPGAATFFDMIVLGRERLGIPHIGGSGVDGNPFFFEINFQGYGDNADDHDDQASGDIKHVAGPYRFKALLQSADFQLDSTGTSYDLKFAVADDLAFSDANYKTPTQIISLGETIEEHIDDFTNQWNEYIKQTNADSKTELDSIKFELKNLTGDGQEIIKNSQLEKGIDSVTSAENTEIVPSSGKSLDATTSKDGTTRDFENVESNKVKIEVPPGTSVETYIGMLLARNTDYTSSMTRSTIDDNGEAKLSGKVNVNDFKINALVKQMKYDEEREGFSKQVIYVPTLYGTPSEKQFGCVEELTLDESTIRQRVNNMEIKRAYEYMFTGRNDQILQVDLKYDLGINFLIPPAGAGGKFGNAVLNNISSFSVDPAKPGTQLSGKDLANFAATFQNAKKFLKLFKAAKDGSISELAKAAGLDANQIKEVVQDRAGATAKGLIESLSNRQIGQAVADSILPKGASNQLNVATESDRQRLIDSNVGEEYTPELSGYIYGGDLLGGQQIYADALTEDEAKESIQDNIAEKKNILKPGTENALLQHETYSGGPTSVGQNLFGYMYGQKDTSDILYTLDMVVRGDPWYLGEPDKTGGINYDKIPSAKDEKSTEDGINQYGSDSFILFELRQPMYFDPFVNQEDLNEGLYAAGRQSYFITGIYRILEIASSFDNGRFTVNVRSAKEVTLDLSQIKNRDDLTLDDIQKTFEENIRVKAALDAADHNSEEDRTRFDDPAYTQGVLDLSGNTLTIEDLVQQGAITSEQQQAYNNWKRGG